MTVFETIPLVTDREFAFGMSQIPPPPSTYRDECDEQWQAVATHIIRYGLGEYPRIQVNDGIDLRDALRFVGAMLMSPSLEERLPWVACWLEALFHTLHPENGPLATGTQE